ncbi:MAG TPA: hypothetical protein VFA56_03880 [Gaiellaceae bacterium]|nr:hypothetical protein [Gaiellaceae bacterium]
MADQHEELWIPLVDEPIGSIVQAIVDGNPELQKLVESPRRILAFRTFAYIRCGILLGELLFAHDVPAYDGSESWVEALLRNPQHSEALAAEVRAVAEEIAADPKYADEEPLGPDDAARERFRQFARERLEQS